MRIGSTKYLDDGVVEALKQEVLTAEEYADDVTDCEEYVEWLLGQAKNAVTRRKIPQEVIEYRRQLFVWRLVHGEDAWEEFLAGITANGLAARPLAQIKKTVNDRFILEYERFEEATLGPGKVVFSGIASLNWDPKASQLVVVFDDVAYAGKLAEVK